MYEFSSLLNDPYPSVVPYSVWPVAGALTDQVIVAPVCVMSEAPTALMASGEGVALAAMNGIAKATIPKIMAPVEIQSQARPRRGAGGVVSARSSVQRVPSQKINRRASSLPEHRANHAVTERDAVRPMGLRDKAGAGNATR